MVWNRFFIVLLQLLSQSRLRLSKLSSPCQHQFRFNRFEVGHRVDAAIDMGDIPSQKQRRT